jgi:dienelactone hydrolase
MQTINEAGVVGLFARPSSNGPHPGVIAFGGSGGGLGPAAAWAPALAEHGYAVLALAYFGLPGLPRDLRNIDVEVVAKAAQWLDRQPGIAPTPLAVMGVSRGSELAFLAGIHVERIGPVVALAPSGVAWFALDTNGPADAPTWILNGTPVPYPWPAGGVTTPTSQEPVALRPMFEHLLLDRAAIRRAEIAIEHCPGPLLLVSGDADLMWPSTTFAELITKRLARTGATLECTHLRYPDAGHAFAGPTGTPVPSHVPAHPLTGASYAFGGTETGNAAAQADSWPRIIEFLDTATRDSLKRRPSQPNPVAT